ncbi:MAG TPA: response regulator [Steroidobacteraceae bacterium]|nr:response regulator [Steroidobacteraceae bacterium]
MGIERVVNILIVDDEPANLIALEAILEPLGQNLVKATSGKDALRAVLNQDFAMILLDVQMPNMNGIETAALIRARERSRHTPIIFLTGAMKSAEMMFQGYSAGAVDYLMKPIETQILRAKVEVFVELAQARLKSQEEIAERLRAANEIYELNVELEHKNNDLTAANADLEMFAQSISHDLRMPLRHVHSYVGLLEESASRKMTAEELQFMRSIQNASVRMSKLIDALLAFSRIGRASMRMQAIDMDDLVRDTLTQLQPDLASRHIDFQMRSLPAVTGDPDLLRQVWVNLLANAVKYTRPRDPALIEIGSVAGENEIVFHVRDNGVGFNMQYADRLFSVFQRMHSDSEFEGTGVGLANVKRIIQRHGGRTWAEAKVDEGATIYFTLPAQNSELISLSA